MFRRFAFLLALMMAVSVLPLPVAATDSYATQTIMVYMVGSDLESKASLATGNLSEMLRSGYDTERVNLLVMAGGSNRWSTPLIRPDSLGIYHMTGRQPQLIHQQPTKSMGEAATLSEFLAYGVEHYPADSYGLLLWNHGAGPLIGYGVDEVHGGDGLLLLEMRDALENSPFNGGNRLEWMGFGACLMANMEVALMMAPYARYMFASEEVSPGRGLSYTALKEISQGSLNGRDVGTSFIEATFNYYEGLAEGTLYSDFDVTFSLLDLERVQAVHDAADALFEDLQHGLPEGLYSDIARRRDATKEYGRTATSNLYDLVDLNDLATNLSTLYPDKTARLKETIADVVLLNRSNIAKTAGLSIYFPFSNKEFFAQRWQQVYQQFGTTPYYQEFLDQFGDILMADSLAAWKGADAPPIQQDADTGDYYVQTNPAQLEHYDRAEYYILAHRSGEEYQLVYTSGDVTQDADGRLIPNFDGKILYLGDNTTGQTVIPYLYEQEIIDGVSQYLIPVLFGRTESNGQYVTSTGHLRAQVDKNTGEARISGAIADPDHGQMTGKLDIDLNEYTHVYLVMTSFYLTRAETGEPLPLGDWVSSGEPLVHVLSVADGLNATYDDLALDQYNYYTILSMIDTQGHVYASELMPLSGERFTQAEVLKPERPAVLEATVDAADQRTLALMNRDGMRATLLSIQPGKANAEDGREAPDTLYLNLLLENETQQHAIASLEWLTVNNQVVPAVLDTAVDALGTVQAQVFIPIAPQEDGTGLVDLGISKVTDIRLRLRFTEQTQGFIEPALLAASDEIRLTTDMDVGAGYHAPDPTESTVLLDTPDLLVEQAGAAYTDDAFFHLPLRITNRSQVYDMIEISEIAFNGIMSDAALPGDGLPPGSVMHTRVSIRKSPTVLPEDMQQFALLYAKEQSLEKLGITEVQQVMLRLALDVRSRRGLTGRMGMRELLAPIIVDISGTTDAVQPLDTEGRVLHDQDGLTIVLLDSDPDGRTFYLKNAGTATIRVRSFDRVRVDGVFYPDNFPLEAVVSPGMSAYAKLFDYLPGIEPEGRELTFHFHVLDTDYNRLLMRSDEIQLSLVKE